MAQGKKFAAEFALRRNVSALDKILIQDSDDDVVKYAYPPQIASLSGYAYANSIQELPTIPKNKAIGYIVGQMLYIYVGEGGDTRNGLYQSVGFFVGPQGVQGEKGEKGERGEQGIQGPKGDNGGFSTEELNKFLEGKNYITEDALTDILADYVSNTSLMRDYVTISKLQDVTGVKNFKAGVQLDGLPMYKSKEDTIFLDANLVLRGSLTMFGKNTTTTPSIFDLLPIDNETIKRNENGQLYAVAGGGGGVADSVAWSKITDKPTWIGAEKPSYSYSEITGTPDLGGFVTAESLTELLSGKADKAKTLAEYGITDAYTKDELGAEFKKYMLKDTAQSISAIHDFKKGLLIDGLAIKKSQDKTIYIDGNLVVSGAMTMFGKDSTTFPTIWANIPFNPDHMTWDGSQWSVVGGGGASVTYDSVVKALGYTPLSNTGGTVNGDITFPYGYRVIGPEGNIAGTRIFGDSTRYRTILGTETLNTLLIGYNTLKFWKGTVSKEYEIIDTSMPSISFPKYIATGIGTTSNSGYRILGSDIDATFGANDTSGGPYIWVASNHALRFATNGAERMRITEDGKVAMGGDTADEKLHVHGNVKVVGNISASIGTLTANSSTLLHLNNSNSINKEVGINFLMSSTSKGWVGFGAEYGTYLYTNAGSHKLGVSEAGVGFIDLNTILHSDNYSDYALPITGGTVNGDITFPYGYRVIGPEGNIAGTRIFGDSTRYRTILGTETLNTLLIGYNTLKFWKGTVSKEYEIIDTSMPSISFPKYIATGIGTTSNSGYRILGSDIDATFGANDTSGGPYIWVASNHALRFATNGAERMRITPEGNVAMGDTTASEKLHVYGNILATGAITMFSQASLKNIINREGLSLDELAKIRPARFTWKDGRDERVHVGVIAENILPILPEVVYFTGEEKTKTVDYASLATHIGVSLIRPVIDHETRIKYLEAQVKTLENENKKLKQLIA